MANLQAPGESNRHNLVKDKQKIVMCNTIAPIMFWLNDYVERGYTNHNITSKRKIFRFKRGNIGMV